MIALAFVDILLGYLNLVIYYTVSHNLLNIGVSLFCFFAGMLILVVESNH